MKGQAAGRGDAIALRRLLHEHLAPEAWPRPGLSPINKLVCGAIIVGSALTIVETEPAVHAVIPEPMFFAAELTFALLFLVE
jgi:voltage-gated potassium channel